MTVFVVLICIISGVWIDLKQTFLQKLSLFGSHNRGLCNQLQTTGRSAFLTSCATTKTTRKNRRTARCFNIPVLTFILYSSYNSFKCDGSAETLLYKFTMWSLYVISNDHRILWHSVNSIWIFFKRSHQAMMSSFEEEDDEHTLQNRKDGGPQQEDVD